MIMKMSKLRRESCTLCTVSDNAQSNYLTEAEDALIAIACVYGVGSFLEQLVVEVNDLLHVIKSKVE